MPVTDRKTPPFIKDAVQFNLELKPCHHFQLRNGVDVYTIHAGAEEVMSLEWVFFAGNAYEEKNMVAASANFLLRNGISRMNAFQINEHFDFYGAFLNRACYTETATLSLHCLNKHIAALLPVVRELVTDSVMPQNELDIYRDNSKQRLKVNLQKSDFVAGRQIDAYLYGKDHPYGKYSTEEDLDALNREELIKFYQQYYQQGRFIIFAAGRLPANLEQLLNEQFGDLPVSSVPLRNPPVLPAAEKKYRIVNDEKAVQGSVRLARPFPGRHHPDFLKVMVLNTLLGGFFGSRLMKNIREEKGYTYGIHSYLQNHMHQTAWMISTEAGRDVAEAAIEETFKEMKRLQLKAVPEKELLLVRNYLMGTLLGDLDGPFQIIGRWKNIILNNHDEDYFNRYVDTVKTISAKELKLLAQQYLNEEEFYNLVVY